MSAYVTQSDVLSQIQMADLIACTDDSNTGNIDQSVLNSVIAAASGYIDRKVGNVYDVPFTIVPPSVKSMALTITCWMLYRRRLVPGEKNNFDEDYKSVNEFLNAVHKREDVLDLSVTADFSQVQANTRQTIYSNGFAVSNTM